MEVQSVDPNLWELDGRVFFALRDALDENHTYEQLFKVMPDVYSKPLWQIIEAQSRRSHSSPAEVLLKRLGDQGVRTSLLEAWLEELGLERILTLLKKDEPLKIIENPPAELNLMEGSTLYLSCKAISFPSPNYQWFLGDRELLLQKKAELIIENIGSEYSGIYTCRVHKINTARGDLSWDFTSSAHVTIFPQISLPIFDQKIKRNEIMDSSSFCSEDSDESMLQTCRKIKGKLKEISLQNRGLIRIIRQPKCAKEIPSGSSLILTCEVSCTLPVSYQWICDRREIPGATADKLHLKNIVEENGRRQWEYMCRVCNEVQSVLTDSVMVKLEPFDHGPFFAVEKLALLIACDEYQNMANLSSHYDVEALSVLLWKMGFKVLTFRNLNRTQMQNVILYYSKMLRPGSYSLVYYGGHSFEYCGQLHLQPIDCSNKAVLEECITSGFIIHCIQEHEPALNLLLFDGCRDELKQNKGIPKVYDQKPLGNTVIVYAASQGQPALEEQRNSCFVKYLLKYLQLEVIFKDVISYVQKAMQTDSHVKGVQFVEVFWNLSEDRTLWDHLEHPNESVFDQIVPWANISDREGRAAPFKDRTCNMTIEDSEIILQFRHHRGVFCNGMDIFIVLNISETADLNVLKLICFNMAFSSDEINKAINKSKVLPKNEIGKRCLQAHYEIQGMQNIEAALIVTLTASLDTIDILTEEFELGFHPVNQFELNKKS